MPCIVSLSGSPTPLLSSNWMRLCTMNCAKTVGTSLHTCHIRRFTPGAHPTYRITSMLPSEVLAADMARSGMTAT
eukprot:1509654-Ditylum_brightwellii.AAC.1